MYQINNTKMNNIKMKKVLLLLLTISVTTMAQEVSFIINDVKEYVSSSNHETTSFDDLQAWDNPGNYWGMHYRYNVKPWTNLGDAFLLTSDEACVFDMRHNGSNYAGESVHWFTIQCVTPSYTRAVYELKYRLKSYHYHNSTAHRTAYFDYNNDANGYWKNRNKTPDGQTYFNTASKETFNTNTTNKETYTYSGEAAAVRISGYLSGNYSTQCYDALYSLPEVEIDNRLNTTENTYNRYGAISASKMKASVSNDKIHYTNVAMAYTVKALYCYKHLTYKANGGIGADQTQTIENTGTTKAANTFSREGYVFSKWTTNADGTGTAYDANATIEATLDSKGPITLYAQWTPTPVPTTYIDENGVEQPIDAWEIINASEVVTWGVAGETTWYVVKGTDVQLAKGAVCLGDVRLILADGAKLTTTGDYNQAGIAVSGEGNSLTIHGQSAQTGQLIANGGNYAAGIGGGNMGDGSNITIHSGTVIANGGGGGAGIGGGYMGGCENIIINGGTVEATSIDVGAGIGGGQGSLGSNIYISDAYMLYAGENKDNTEMIDHSSAQDLGETLEGQKYVKIEGLATPYTRNMSVGHWATVCLPYAATFFEGATFYKVNYYNGTDKLYIEEVATLEAGVPYIFEATAETVTINHDATAPVAYAQTERGLHGSLARTIIESDGHQAAISEDQVVIVEESSTVTVPACRAYINMDEVPDSYQPTKVPLRVMGVPQSPSGLEQSVISNQQSVIKVLKDGQLFFIREGKTYNIQGQMIQ